MSHSQRAHLQASLAPRSSTATPSATSGSQTILQTESGPSAPSGTLRLRASPDRSSTRRIQWAEDVIDNEGMGKKSSKVCCIYHKPNEPGDSDSESDSSSSDEDSEPDLSRARKAGESRNGRGGKKRDHGHGDQDKDGGSAKGKGKERNPSPNAYERQPKYKSK